MSTAPPFTRLYHLAEAVNLPSIEKHGLMSTAASLKRLRKSSDDHEAFLSTHRPVIASLGPGTLVRDQGPMPPHVLSKALTGGWTPEDWYRLLNGFVFFWIDPERAKRQRKACGGRPQVLLVFDAHQLLESFGDLAWVSPINSGNTRRKAVLRGPGTLMPYAQWRQMGWSTGRQWRPPVEVLFRAVIPVTSPFLLEIA